MAKGRIVVSKNLTYKFDTLYNSKGEDVGYVLIVKTPKTDEYFADFIFRKNTVNKEVLDLESTIVHYALDDESFQNKLECKAYYWHQLYTVYDQIFGYIRQHQELKKYGIDIAVTSFPHGMAPNVYISHFVEKLEGIDASFLVSGNYFLPALGKT